MDKRLVQLTIIFILLLAIAGSGSALSQDFQASSDQITYYASTVEDDTDSQNIFLPEAWDENLATQLLTNPVQNQK